MILLDLNKLVLSLISVLLAESPEDLQTSLNTIKDYCSFYLRKPHHFNYGDQNIQVVNEYNYIGLFFNYNSKFNIAKNSIYKKCLKAMFSALNKIRKMSLPFDVAINLFNNLVNPLQYGAEVWGCESLKF